MKREFNVECTIGPPQVAYREAITLTPTLSPTPPLTPTLTLSLTRCEASGFCYANDIVRYLVITPPTMPTSSCSPSSSLLTLTLTLNPDPTPNPYP